MKRNQIVSFLLAVITTVVFFQNGLSVFYGRGTTTRQPARTNDNSKIAVPALLPDASSACDDEFSLAIDEVADAEQEMPPAEEAAPKADGPSAAKQPIHTLEQAAQEADEPSFTEQTMHTLEQAAQEADDPSVAEQTAHPSEQAEEEVDEPSAMEQIATAGNAKRIDVVNILQNPMLPTGCETVSLTILLNHLGYAADALMMARTYLPKLDFYSSDGVQYGADFRTTFAGDPESAHAYGCYAPCIVTTANSYFNDNEIDKSACDLTGTDFDSLLIEYIDQDIPVLIWITSRNLHAPKPTTVWTTPDGETVQWLAYEHCVVLTGYDKEKQLIYVSDPLVGNTSYDYSKLKQRYLDMGQQCVYLP